MIAALRYYDRFAKMDGACLFAERPLYVDWIEERPNEHCDRGPEAPCPRGRDWNGRWIPLRYALENPALASVTALGRRKIGISHTKLRAVLHHDFADCSVLAETLSGEDAAVVLSGHVYRSCIGCGRSTQM